MQHQKIFILLPDGIGLKNFAFTNFHKIGSEKGFDITFWNATPFNLETLGFNEIKIDKPKTHPLTDFYKKAQIQIELNLNIKRAKNKIYDSYRFPFSKRNLKEVIKVGIVYWIIFWNNSSKGINRIKNKIKLHERKTKLYFDSLATLQEEKPTVVFCTNQRITSAVSSILAAQDLGIPTATFIFSWDNLPKGTKIIETDFYFVWSEHMKKELQYYYPYINENQIFITGTPQFEPHFDEQFIVSMETFFKEYCLDLSKKYICFSGDDVTTSPNDPQYLLDVAKAVEKLNLKGENIGVIFRRCPVDFSSRYDTVLEEYKDIIVSINPKWKNIGDTWNAILPTKEDLILQMNTIFYSEFVINLGSSMVFDFVSFKKPCAFINYDVVNKEFPNWSVRKIYNFVHFRSMPTKDSVIWLNSPEEIESIIESLLNSNETKIVHDAQKWFDIINQHPPENASERIWNAIDSILKK
jgi:hypothetical protein